MSAVNLSKQEWTKSNFDDFIVPKYINVPFTTIQNRAQVLDYSNMIQATMGTERFHFRSINLLTKEFGPNGESVFEIDSKDARVRFVGGWVNANNANGNYLIASSTIGSDFFEISFYGTGLNLLSLANGTQYDIRASVDGGVEGSNIYTTTGSAITNGRNYAFNTILNVVSGLSLGQHTVKLRWASTGAWSAIYGAEVLNHISTVTVSTGQAFVGNKKESSTYVSSSSHNVGILGTKGARVSKYLLNGIVSQSVRECAATPSYLTNTNHTNEEVMRRINWKEFGVNRGDDFSTLGQSNSERAFTLDDGITTLVGRELWGSSTSNGLLNNNLNAYFILTFIGTGLDITWSCTATSPEQSTVYIDGVSVGTITSSKPAADSGIYNEKICSGLPYGTHTVKIMTTVDGNDRYFYDFIIYQPKKPSIPVGAIEIADYNVMANHIFNTSTSATNFISQGVSRKTTLREMTYSGTWAVAVVDTINHSSGFGVTTATIGGYLEYTFWGTGFELGVYTSASYSSSITMLLNGVTATASNFPTATFNVISPVTYNTTTAIINVIGADGPNRRIGMSNLPLGKYTVRFTNNTASIFNISSLDIITPIHINHPTLRIGNLSLADNSKIGAIRDSLNLLPDFSKAKAWCKYDFTTGKILSSYNISQVIRTGAGTALVYFSKRFKSENYIVAGSCYDPVETFSFVYAVRKQTADKFQANMWYSNTGAGFDGTVMFTCFGELIDE